MLAASCHHVPSASWCPEDIVVAQDVWSISRVRSCMVLEQCHERRENLSTLKNPFTSFNLPEEERLEKRFTISIRVLDISKI
ncbi:hypothetical protein E2C01_099882 [Portunus trituberculatus]|uniref:Uncharacterized protein n=1 Tax=Portunus trituberculatus TaxID=210409 RepID=A0A5B7KG02_PORTR|nr:hypothetical protein [Portunus trituberculatus]